mmetsp:Transcript_3757/g.13292  ORF Transcript_3757/g.13292 Transcript_3757/m.13292 type:complete len:490 (-) Transcript_3757:58-1527(-)
MLRHQRFCHAELRLEARFLLELELAQQLREHHLHLQRCKACANAVARAHVERNVRSARWLLEVARRDALDVPALGPELEGSGPPVLLRTMEIHHGHRNHSLGRKLHAGQHSVLRSAADVQPRRRVEAHRLLDDEANVLQMLRLGKVHLAASKRLLGFRTGLVLHLGVLGQQPEGPGERHRGGLRACNEEANAVREHCLHRQRVFSQHHLQHIVGRNEFGVVDVLGKELSAGLDNADSDVRENLGGLTHAQVARSGQKEEARDVGEEVGALLHDALHVLEVVRLSGSNGIEAHSKRHDTNHLGGHLRQPRRDIDCGKVCRLRNELRPGGGELVGCVVEVGHHCLEHVELEALCQLLPQCLPVVVVEKEERLLEELAKDGVLGELLAKALELLPALHHHLPHRWGRAKEQGGLGQHVDEARVAVLGRNVLLEVVEVGQAELARDEARARDRCVGVCKDKLRPGIEGLLEVHEGCAKQHNGCGNAESENHLS